ncbi:unnamed protein product [Symbiodinium sp. CCMP2592]|nr:unnamed protein product [Symbiodinium sp. CCMP2592]
MASRVNTKFVVILIVAVVAILGMLFAAYTVVTKTPEDLARKGDEAMAAGDHETAREMYSRAVSKDPTIVENLEKWIETIEMWIPETEPAFYDAFRRDYLGAIHQAAIVQRTNVDAYHREIGLQFELLRREYSRSMADNIISRTTQVLGNFDGLSGVDPAWPTLRRYRGLAWYRIAERGGVIEPEQYDLIRDDLTAALEANPEDELTRTALMRWLIIEAVQQVEEEDITPVVEARAQAVAMGEAHMTEYPNSPLVAVTLMGIKVESSGSDAYYGDNESDSARTQAILSSWTALQSELDELQSWLMSLEPENLSMIMLNRFVEVEIRIDPSSRLSRSNELVKKVLAADPESIEAMVSAAGLSAIRGDIDEAVVLYKNIIDLPPQPIGIDGIMLFNSKREAMLTTASIKLDSYARMQNEPDTDPAVMQSELDEAIAARDQYASRVTEDNTNLMLIDGRLEYVNGKFEDSLRLLSMYNQQTDNSNTDGLWFEALAARELRQLGTTRDALERLIAKKSHDVRALLVLADTYMQLQDNRKAKELFQKALVSDPANQTALNGIAKIEAFDNPDLIDDPVAALIIRARQVRRGKDGQPGDISEAINILRDGLESVNYAPDVVRDLVSMMLDQGDINGSRALLDRAVAANPDDRTLSDMQTAAQGNDESEILIRMIELSDREELDKLISIAGVAFTRGKFDVLDDTIARLLEVAPDDSRVIDLAFVRAIGLDQEDRAKEFAELATKNNTDRVGGLTYQARLASYQGNNERAVQLLQQAGESGVAGANVFRMLGIEQRGLGREEAAIESFERALSIRPDDQSSIMEYINTLNLFRRYNASLDIARRFQKYAIDNPEFLTIWLTLEAAYGGPEGQEFAIRQREKFLELDPNNIPNNFALASLYIETRRWDEAQQLIDQISAEEDSLRVAELKARWYADQGRVGNVNGLSAAQQVFTDYIEKNQDEIDAAPYISLARFMLDRGRPELAIQAASNAVERQDPETLDGTKLLGDLFLMLNQYANAATEFEKVVEGGADIEDNYRLRLIDMLIRTRQFESARKHFDLLVKENQTTKIAMLQNSEIEEGLGNSAEALRLLDQAVATFSDDPLVYIKRAEYHAGNEERLTDLLADVDAALQINRNDWRAYRVRAAGYFAVDQRKDALRDLQRAVRLNPSLDQALYGIINEMMIDNRNSEAYDFALEIVQSRMKDASLLNSLGQLFASRGDWEHATQFYKIVWNTQRTPNAGATLIDSLVRTRNPDTNLANSIIQDLTDIAGEIDSSPGLLAAQALILQARGRDQLALQQLTKAFDLSSNDDQLLIQWSGNISRFFEGQPMNEQIEYLQTLKQRNTNPEVLNWIDLFIAQRLVSVGQQTDIAFRIYDKLSQARSQPVLQRLTLQSYGTTMFTQGQFDRAAEMWGKGVELFPGDWEMSNNLAYVLSAELGEHERALELALSAIEMNPNRSEPYDTLGNIYTALGEYDKASEVLANGMKYALSVRSRVTLVIAQINIDLAQGRVSEARSKLTDIQALMRAMPTRDVGLEQDVEAIEAKIDSAG